MMESYFSPSFSWIGACFLRRIRQLIPAGFKDELKNLSMLALPASLTQLLVMTVGCVSAAFCGHLGRVELDAVALATATYGAHNLLRVGVILQRAIIVLILTCFPCWALLINTESILLLLGQEPEVARLSQLYVKIFMPALPASFMYDLQSRYLQNQGIIWPQVITGFVANLINALMNYIVLFAFNMGVVGSALANNVSRFSMAGILYAYILWKGLHKVTWGGWSKDCLEDWGSFFYLALPSMVMMCAEWWTFEIAIFLAGLISEVELGAQSIIYELTNCAYMFPLGFSVAGCVRVGHTLGAGKSHLAKLSTKLTIFFSVCLVVIIGSFRHHIASLFTSDDVFLQVAGGGIIRGMGKQKVGALCTILGYYGVCLPVGVPLMFSAKLGIKGTPRGSNEVCRVVTRTKGP
uniref:Solute carrier family 47 member 3 n=1 Tax=Hippocampus comes TaxID=109280 RepID=A0A3Q3DI64_HIPCM